MKLLKYTIDLEGSNYVHFSIEGGNKEWTIGDQVWFSDDGKEMEIDELALSDEDIREELEGYIGGDMVEKIKEILDDIIRPNF